MAEAIVGVLSKLQGVAVKEGMALAALGDEIERLRDKLMWLHLLVHEIDLRSRTDDNLQIRVLVWQVREVASATEDAIDHFFQEADLSRFGHNWRRAAAMFFSNFSTQIRVRYILSRKIKSLNARLEGIVDNSTKYGINNGITEAVTWRASRVTPPVCQNCAKYDIDNGSTEAVTWRASHVIPPVHQSSAKYDVDNGRREAITWRASSVIPPIRQNWNRYFVRD